MPGITDTAVTAKDDVSGLVAEYRELLRGARGVRTTTGDLSCERLAKLLSERAEWSGLGAEHLVALVRQNGVFVLRNALAVAVALDVEDGDLGF